MTVGRVRLVVRGEVRVPGDKSVSHRALMFSALADGRSTIRGVLQSADTESTAGRTSRVRLGGPRAFPRDDGRGERSHPSPVARHPS
jgi:hypothetical protein